MIDFDPVWSSLIWPLSSIRLWRKLFAVSRHTLLYRNERRSPIGQFKNTLSDWSMIDWLQSTSDWLVQRERRNRIGWFVFDCTDVQVWITLIIFGVLPSLKLFLSFLLPVVALETTMSPKSTSKSPVTNENAGLWYLNWKLKYETLYMKLDGPLSKLSFFEQFTFESSKNHFRYCNLPGHRLVFLNVCEPRIHE